MKWVAQLPAIKRAPAAAEWDGEEIAAGGDVNCPA